KKREIVCAQYIVMFFCIKLTNLSLSDIGSKLGGKDFKWVVHGFRNVANKVETDIEFKSYIDDVNKKLASY
ncbi:MAG: helix-turn-helix domain-containing protein, partial [Bacteroidota bacterium]